jgi:hypothetical protein
MAKQRIFVSFEFETDRVLRDFVIGQSRLGDSPFEIVDTSLKEEAPQKDWEDKARRAISGSDRVVVMLGPTTYRASGVLKEVGMANALGKPICQIIGYKDGDYRRIPDAGVLYSWNWDNLKKVLG